jgi:hypothetical protein
VQTRLMNCLWPIVLAAGLIAGCEDVDSDDLVAPRVIGGADEGRVNLALAETPTDRVDRITVAVSAVQFKRADGELLEIPLVPPVIARFPDFSGSSAFGEPITLLRNEPLPEGAFDWMRLVFDDTRLFVEVDGRQLPLRLEESFDSALLDFDVVITEDTELDLTVVLDLRRSLIPAIGSQFVLRPSLRIVQPGLSGTLVGTVDNRLLEADDCTNDVFNDRGNAVFIFRGANAPVQDIRNDLLDPFTSALITRLDTGLVEFRAGFLPPGDFTVVFTCDSLLDHPLLNDELEVNFSDAFNVRIESGQTTRVTVH